MNPFLHRSALDDETPCPPTPGDVKAQWVRLLDVALIGPLMVWGGDKLSSRHAIAGNALKLLGYTTVLYNAWNFQRVERRRRE